MKPFTQVTDVKPPPGTYRTSWVGNTFSGAGGKNGFGYWVQNSADEIEVSPDGTVIAGLGWDEAGRCAGLYKDGKVNRVLLKVPSGQGNETAWGWGTGNNALTVSGGDIFIANTGKRLLHFRWKPGDLNSAEFVRQAEMRGEAVGLNARDGRIVAVYKDGVVEMRSANDLKPTGQFTVKDAKDAVLAADGSLWVLAGNSVRRYSAEGRALGEAVPDLQKPTALSFENRGRLIVTDNGPRQQVLFYEVSDAPKLVSTFGVKGGLYSGFAGQMEPQKLFALAGAGTDAKGNLYVGMSFAQGPSGNLFLRSFTPAGKLRWEVMSTAFVDTFGFLPGTDGAGVFSRTGIFHLNLNRAKPGSEWKLHAITLDPLNQPDDPRLTQGSSTLVRKPEGRLVVYVIGQYAGGYRIYTNPDPAKGHTLRETNRILATKEEGEQWAWDVDDSAGIWHGDAPGKTIRHYPLKGFDDDDSPVYDWKNPQAWPWPEGWKIVRRIQYDEKDDALFLSGYLEGDRVESWGVTGETMRRYDGWLKGGKKLRWTIQTPHDGNTDEKEGPLSPSSFDVAGEYIFFGMVKPTNNRQYVHVFRTADGKYVGSFEPGPSVVTPGTEPGVGWLDMPYSLQAMRRRNGEYLVLVEEDWRGKNLLYRWTPPGAAAKR